VNRYRTKNLPWWDRKTFCPTENWIAFHPDENAIENGLIAPNRAVLVEMIYELRDDEGINDDKSSSSSGSEESDWPKINKSQTEFYRQLPPIIEIFDEEDDDLRTESEDDFDEIPVQTELKAPRNHTEEPSLKKARLRLILENYLKSKDDSEEEDE